MRAAKTAGRWALIAALTFGMALPAMIYSLASRLRRVTAASRDMLRELLSSWMALTEPAEHGFTRQRLLQAAGVPDAREVDGFTLAILALAFWIPAIYALWLINTRILRQARAIAARAALLGSRAEPTECRLPDPGGFALVGVLLALIIPAAVFACLLASLSARLVLAENVLSWAVLLRLVPHTTLGALLATLMVGGGFLGYWAGLLRDGLLDLELRLRRLEALLPHPPMGSRS